METYGVSAKRGTKNGKPVVVVTFPCGRSVTLGGARAARAAVVVVAEYGRYPNYDDHPKEYWNGDGSMPLHVVGLRADARRAAGEAAGLLNPKPQRDKWGHRYPANRAATRAAAVPVEG